jgi:hypothetical protein
MNACALGIEQQREVVGGNLRIGGGAPGHPIAVCLAALAAVQLAPVRQASRGTLVFHELPQELGDARAASIFFFRSSSAVGVCVHVKPATSRVVQGRPPYLAARCVCGSLRFCHSLEI